MESDLIQVAIDVEVAQLKAKVQDDRPAFYQDEDILRQLAAQGRNA